MVVQVHQDDLGSQEVDLVAETLVIVVVSAPVDAVLVAVFSVEAVIITILGCSGGCNKNREAHEDLFIHETIVV
jgi:hypothetical protein